MNENIKDNEETNIDIQEFLKQCKEENIDESKIPAEILSLFEKLYTKRQQENKPNTALLQQSVSYIDGISIEDIKYINEISVKETEKYTNEKFDMENLIHREYFEYFKQQALKSKEQEIKMKQFEKSLHDKYGQMYPDVENAARNTFENMAYRDAKNIILSRMKGDIETLITFYDNVYKGLMSEKENKEPLKEDIIFPPKAIKGGNFKNNNQKQLGYENFI